MIVHVADGAISITTNFMVFLRDGGRYNMRMKIASCRSVLQPDHVPVFEEADIIIEVQLGLIPSRKDSPLIILVFIVIASDLLLQRPNG